VAPPEPSADGPTAGGQTPRPRRSERVLSLLAPFVGLVLVIALFALLVPDRFLSTYNLSTILTQTVIVALGAVGMTFVIVSGGIDLSVGSVIALTSVVTAILLREGAPPPMAVTVGVASGALFGVLNGAIIAGAGIAPFIVTLGTMGVARGGAKYLAGEQKVDAPASWVAELMRKSPEPPWLLVAPGVWVMLLVAVVMGLVLQRTVFGTHTFAVGSSEATAHLCGVRVRRVKVLVYGLAGLFAGLAGVMQFARLTVGDPTTALGAELHVIAAVVIGGASLTGGSGTILGSMIGAFLMAVLSNGLNLTGVPTYVQEILVGIIIVAAVAADRLGRRSGQGVGHAAG
jgi:ribose transport system permease protein